MGCGGWWDHAGGLRRKAPGYAVHRVAVTSQLSRYYEGFFLLKPGWCKECSAYSFSSSQHVVVEASARGAVLSCPCLCLCINTILQAMDLARGPS